jgi:hypothetical protein
MYRILCEMKREGMLYWSREGDGLVFRSHGTRLPRWGRLT